MLFYHIKKGGIQIRWKSQKTINKYQINPKSQFPNLKRGSSQAVWNLVIWSLEFIWNLGFGIWRLV
jgi:hypothetical protein